MNWQRLFLPHILDRGLDYYQEGAVENFESGDDSIEATVLGSEAYDVSISMRDGKIADMYCDCPYAEQENNCKHMAAVLFFMEEETGINQEKNLKKTPNAKDSIRALVDDADEKIVRDFLLTILKNDTGLFLQFKNILHCEISDSDMKLYKRRIDSICSQHAGRDGFIDYYNASSFVAELEEFLENDIQGIVKSRYYREAFELTTYLLVEMGDQDMDDSDGGTYMLADTCVNIWEEIIEQCDIEIKRIMFEWCMKALKKSELEYMEDYIERILFASFEEKEFIEAKLKFTADEVSAYTEEDSSWSKGYNAERCAVHHIALMKENNFSDCEIEEYCRENLKFNSVRECYIQDCIDKNEYQLAINLLKEGKIEQKDSSGLVIKYSRQLKQLYKQMNNQKDYENELWLLLVEYSANDMNIYKELRSVYSETEWLEKREVVFRELSSRSFVDDLYEEEKLYDRLLKAVLDSMGLYKLMKYETCLKELYPNDLLKKYEVTVRDMAIRTSDRKRYQELVAILRRMQTYPDSSEVVCKIISDWRVMYKNRRAMMDELNKL